MFLIQNPLPTAATCFSCQLPIGHVGGQKLVHTKLRGTVLLPGSHRLPRKNYRYARKIQDNPQLYLHAWGEESFMSKSILERVLDTYLSGLQPWFCQRCGKRACHLCGQPNLWLAYGDYAFNDVHGSYYHKGANLGASPPCINRQCRKYREVKISEADEAV
jgi:hypothetical protein